MTALDLAVAVIVALSVLFAALRGFVRSAVSLAAWFVALVLAVRLGPAVATVLTDLQLPAPAPQALGFGLVFLGVLIGGSLLGMLLARLLQAVGLGPLDRLLGAVFGFGRGLLVVLAGVLVAGLTAIPRQDWWQNSFLAPRFADVVLSLRSHLPADWADRLDYSAAGRKPAAPANAVEPRGQRT
jgi:membrane protein required for colicin V production